MDYKHLFLKNALMHIMFIAMYIVYNWHLQRQQRMLFLFLNFFSEIALYCEYS
jgi:hypothetical protein